MNFVKMNSGSGIPVVSLAGDAIITGVPDLNGTIIPTNYRFQVSINLNQPLSVNDHAVVFAMDSTPADYISVYVTDPDGVEKGYYLDVRDGAVVWVEEE